MQSLCEREIIGDDTYYCQSCHATVPMHSGAFSCASIQSNTARHINVEHMPLRLRDYIV